MKRTFFYTVSAVIACMAFLSCSDDDNYNGRVIEEPSEMPEIFKGIWTGSLKGEELGEQGLMFDFTSGKLIARKFSYANGEGEGYNPDFRYNVDKRQGEISLKLDGMLSGKWEFDMVNDSTMIGSINNKDSVIMRYVAPDTENWWERRTFNTRSYGSGPTTDLNLDLMNNIDKLNPKEPFNPFDWFTPKGILSEVAKTIVSTIASRAFGVGLDFLFKGEDPVMGQLCEINTQLSDINRKLADVLYLMEKQDYARAYRERMLLYKDLDLELTTITSMMENSDGSDESQKAIMTAINRFCNMQIGTALVSHAVAAYINRLTELPPDLVNKNMGDVYDYIIYNTTAWEADGYEPRLMLRCSDASLIARLACVTIYYWTYGDSPADKVTRQKEIDAIVKAVDDYTAKCKEYDEKINFIVDEKVVKNEDYAVCQIRGAHIKFAKNKFHRDEGHPGPLTTFIHYNKNTQVNKWINVDQRSNAMYYSVWGFDPGVIESHSPGENEIKAILNYYGNKKSLKEILEENVDETPNWGSSQNYLILQGGGYHKATSIFDSRRDMFVNKAIDCNKVGATVGNWCICRIEWKSTRWYIEETDSDREGFHAWVEKY